MLYLVRRERGGGAKVKHENNLQEIEVLTICKICYFLSLPLPKLQKSKSQCSAGSSFKPVKLSGSR